MMREYACTATDHPCGCYDQFLSERTEIERLNRYAERLRANAERDANEIERLRTFAKWVQDHSNDPGVVLKAAAALEPKP